MDIRHASEDLRQWYIHACRRIAIHPFAFPIILLTLICTFVATQAPCMEPEEKAGLYRLEAAERKARIRQLYAYHESRDPCGVQERVLLERIDSAKTGSP